MAAAFTPCAQTFPAADPSQDACSVRRRPSIFSFFTGAGFLDLGLEHAGFSVDFVNEFRFDFLRGYRHSRKVLGSPAPRYGHHLGSVEEFLSEEWADRLRWRIGDARRQSGLVGFVGGPPCPDFSVMGKNAGSAGDNGRLSGVYAELITTYRPDFFVFENVQGLWRTRIHREFYDSLKARFAAAGYVLHDRLINCIRYGAPQDRRRIFLIGILDGSPGAEFAWEAAMTQPANVLSLPWPTENPFGIADLPAPVGLPREVMIQTWFERNDVHNHPNGSHYFTPRAGMAKFESVPEGRVGQKSFKRLHRWRYSPTACYGNNEVHLHPCEPRRISVAEALAIQSLPKEFELPEDMPLSAMFKTIGNGVPYLAARGIGTALMGCLSAHRVNLQLADAC